MISSLGPVPASSVLKMVLSAAGETEITLCDTAERTVERVTAEPVQWEVTLDLITLPEGICLLRRTSGGADDSRLVVITR